MKEIEIEFLIGGKSMGSTFLHVDNGKLGSISAEDYFYSILRKNEKSLIREAEAEEKEEIINRLTSEQEEKLKTAHMAQYTGTDDDAPDDYEDWLMGLELYEIKKII